MADRTAPFAAIRQSALSRVNDHTARNITHHVAIPGLKKRDGSPLVIEVTYTVEEIGYDWASFIVDYQFDSDPVVYGNHPMAIGPLREILPEAYRLPDYPANLNDARAALRKVIAHHDLGGTLVTGDADGRTMEYYLSAHNTLGENRDMRARRATTLIQEYVPFSADVWWDDANEVVRIRPARNEVKHIVRTA